MLRHYIIAKRVEHMHKRYWDTVLYGIADDQAGYFTAAQARAAGLHQVRLVQLAQQGDIERVSRGVYRFTRFPISRLGRYMEAVLWPQVRRSDVSGVISHQSALAIHELSDVSPARVHVTLPTTVRIRREVPRSMVVHYADLPLGDVQRVESVPVTTPARSIRDAHASHLGNELVGQAIADGRRSGVLSMAEADRLERELLGTKPTRRRSIVARRDGACRRWRRATIQRRYNGATMNYRERIVRDARIVGGEPVLRGTRVTLRTVLASLAEGASTEEILADFPTLSAEDVRAVIAFAAASAQEDLPLAEVHVKR
jgi:uncharacterized protein (DUF433 family)